MYFSLKYQPRLITNCTYREDSWRRLWSLEMWAAILHMNCYIIYKLWSKERNICGNLYIIHLNCEQGFFLKCGLRQQQESRLVWMKAGRTVVTSDLIYYYIKCSQNIVLCDKIFTKTHKQQIKVAPFYHSQAKHWCQAVRIVF